MSLRPASHRILFGGLSFLLSTPAVTAVAQDPVQKPGSGARTADRLPAPQSVTVRQTGGTITLSWAPVEGAKSYVLGRAVGNDGFRRLLDASTGPATVYVDRQITPGVRHVYTVTPVSQADVAGMRATSEAIVPSPASQPAVARPITVTATLLESGKVSLSWQGAGEYIVGYSVSPEMDGQLLRAYPTTSRFSLVTDALSPGRYRFVVSPVDRYNNVLAPTTSNEVIVPEVTTPVATTPTATAPATSATADATAAVLVSVAASTTLRVGGTASLPAAGQWTSLDSGVATVNASGTVTGRAAGTARMVALGAGSDGAVRVTVVRVVVQP